jgi:hypothetical protein
LPVRRAYVSDIFAPEVVAMQVTFRQLQPVFAGEVTSPISLRETFDEETLAQLRVGMDQ